MHFRNSLANRDVVLYIDNQSVCASLTKGASKSDDLQLFTTAWHCELRTLCCRVWIEWVPSHTNPADELSRHKLSRYTEPPYAANTVERLKLPCWTLRNANTPLAPALRHLVCASAA